MAELQGSRSGMGRGEMETEVFDVLGKKCFEALDCIAGEVGVESTAKGAVLGVRACVLDVFWWCQWWGEVKAGKGKAKKKEI